MFFGLLGEIENPLCKINSNCYGDFVGREGVGGLTGFIGNVFNFIAIAAGIFTLFNLVTAGLEYVGSQGDPKAIESARNKILMSVIGMIIIAGSFLFIAILGQLLFGSPSAILNPIIRGPGTLVN